MSQHVLVVDDDPVSLLLLRHMLETHGCSVADATGVSEAIEYLVGIDGQLVDIIVSDYLMADGTGLDLLEEVQQHDALASLPFVLLTGVATADELDDRRVDRVSAFVTKPVSSGELIEVIGRFAEQASPAV